MKQLILSIGILAAGVIGAKLDMGYASGPSTGAGPASGAPHPGRFQAGLSWLGSLHELLSSRKEEDYEIMQEENIPPAHFQLLRRFVK